MLTCCPACGTNFRVTPEQLKARAGKVRCGKCQAVFNALDTLVEAPKGSGTATVATGGTEPSTLLPEPPVPVTDTTPATTLPEEEGKAESSPIDEQSAAFVGETADIPPEFMPAEAVPEGQAGDGEPAAPTEAASLSPEAIRDTALAAGLVAARETTQMPGYNKWAEGAFTGTTAIAEAATRPLWPFVLAALLLLAALVGQAAHHFRAELAVASPGVRPLLDTLCAALHCDIPLPRHSELVSIESSDLQIDPARGGLLTLSATLKNRAPYAQSWPLLELTLTDVQDNAVLRRVLEPADYLPAKLDPTVFPPNGEVGLRLWLETQGVVAAGYRLYVFYP